MRLHPFVVLPGLLLALLAGRTAAAQTATASANGRPADHAVAGVGPGQQQAQELARLVEMCEEERFALWLGSFGVARPRGTAPFLIPSRDPCLGKGFAACGTRVPLDPNARWYTGARTDGWVCVTDGKVSGWTPAGGLQESPVPPTGTDDWIGQWFGGGAELLISTSKDGTMLEVSGSAEWRGSLDSVPHVGEIEGQSAIVANRLELGDPRCLDSDYEEEHDDCIECVARLVLVNGRLHVVDNHHCGGMNVNFDGIYDQVSLEWYHRASNVRQALGPGLDASFADVMRAAEELAELDAALDSDPVPAMERDLLAWAALAEGFTRERAKTSATAERERAERALNDAYREARADDGSDEFRDAQRQWIKYRDAWVAFYRLRWKETAPPEVLQREIEMVLTVARTKKLRGQ